MKDINAQRIAGANDYQTRQTFALHVGAAVFGEMVKVAAPVLEHYHSDLFHDAINLHARLLEWNRSEPIDLLWSLDDTGTWLFDEAEPGSWEVAAGRDNVYRLTIFVRDRRYGDEIAMNLAEVDSAAAPTS